MFALTGNLLTKGMYRMLYYKFLDLFNSIINHTHTYYIFVKKPPHCWVMDNIYTYILKHFDSQIGPISVKVIGIVRI